MYSELISNSRFCGIKFVLGSLLHRALRYCYSLWFGFYLYINILNRTVRKLRIIQSLPTFRGLRNSGVFTFVSVWLDYMYKDWNSSPNRTTAREITSQAGLWICNTSGDCPSIFYIYFFFKNTQVCYTPWKQNTWWFQESSFIHFNNQWPQMLANTHITKWPLNIYDE